MYVLVSIDNVPAEPPVLTNPLVVKLARVAMEAVTTLDAKVVPVNVPAGATTAFVDAAVIRPLPLTVKLGIALDDPKDPVFVLTVASVRTADPGPLAVPSPVRAVI
jgi:hypothetical protein